MALPKKKKKLIIRPSLLLIRTISTSKYIINFIILYNYRQPILIQLSLDNLKRKYEINVHGHQQ